MHRSSLPSAIVLGLLGALACTDSGDDGSKYTGGSTFADEAEAESDEDTSGETGSDTTQSEDSGSTSESESESESESTDESESESTGPQTCASDADCVGSPSGEICDTDSGACILCLPGTIAPCYTGADDTLGVGACKAGEWVCLADGKSFGMCAGQVTPKTEQCGNAVDDDCNGIVDDNADADADGWGSCEGDCCDIISGSCFNPELVNPGAYEVEDNEVDDDCNGEVDEPAESCDMGLAELSNDPDDFAMAMELCQFTSLNAPLASKIWGVIDAKISLPNGAPLAHWEQVGIRLITAPTCRRPTRRWSCSRRAGASDSGPRAPSGARAGAWSSRPRRAG
ncbi:MAG: hypothetical protein HC927_10150 [Deltaproteobacteria bacterium]|nr:hypothetical protein [Deltaproteobacteria bacterium]